MNSIISTISAMTISELISHLLVIIGVLSIIIEKSKKLPFNPWSKLFKWIGSKITDSVSGRLDSIETQQEIRMDNLEKQNNQTNELIEEMRNDYKKSISSIKEDYNTRIDKLEKDADEKEVKRLRSNIICFADSCRTNNNHYTKQHYENIFRDYDDYLSYCKRHDFQNHFIDSEMAYIRNVYTQQSAKNFTTEN